MFKLFHSQFFKAIGDPCDWLVRHPAGHKPVLPETSPCPKLYYYSWTTSSIPFRKVFDVGLKTFVLPLIGCFTSKNGHSMLVGIFVVSDFQPLEHLRLLSPRFKSMSIKFQVCCSYSHSLLPSLWLSKQFKHLEITIGIFSNPLIFLLAFLLAFSSASGSL